MATKKTIAIIDATGNVGSAIAGGLAKSPYRLLLMSEDVQKLHDLRKQIIEKSGRKAEIILNACAKEASWEADIIIVATPRKANKEVAEKIRDVAIGKIVISISNPLDSAIHEPVASPGTSAAEELQKLLPHSSVVKTVNTTFAAGFFTPTVDGNRADAFIAGNNSDALDEVSEVIHSTGLNPMVVGDLSVSRSLEQMQGILIKLGKSKYNNNTMTKS
jgi:hypothetical protein